MQQFTVNFAKLNIEIHCRYAYTKAFCREYLTDEAADFAVSVSEEDIDREIAASPYQPRREYAESICVYREIAKRLPLYNRMVFHGAVISYKGTGYLFTAPSGTGKTTHIRLWHQYLDGVEVVNGDKPLLHIEDATAEAFATPYAGKEGYQNHGSILLGGICLIHRGTENRIRRVTAGEVLTELMHQVYLPQEAEAAIKTIDLLDALFKAVPIFLLECDISETAVKTAFEALTGSPYNPKEAHNED